VQKIQEVFYPNEDYMGKILVMSQPKTQQIIVYSIEEKKILQRIAYSSLGIDIVYGIQWPDANSESVFICFRCKNTFNHKLIQLNLKQNMIRDIFVSSYTIQAFNMSDDGDIFFICISLNPGFAVYRINEDTSQSIVYTSQNPILNITLGTNFDQIAVSLVSAASFINQRITLLKLEKSKYILQEIIFSDKQIRIDMPIRWLNASELIVSTEVSGYRQICLYNTYEKTLKEISLPGKDAVFVSFQKHSGILHYKYESNAITTLMFVNLSEETERSFNFSGVSKWSMLRGQSIALFASNFGSPYAFYRIHIDRYSDFQPLENRRFQINVEHLETHDSTVEVLSVSSQSSNESKIFIALKGGPGEKWSNQYDELIFQVLCNDYIVVLPNIRGTIGNGLEHRNSIINKWGLVDVHDVSVVLDYIISRYSTASIVLYGSSYGAYLALLTATSGRSDIIKTICWAPITNLSHAFNTQTNIQHYLLSYMRNYFEDYDLTFRVDPTENPIFTNRIFILHGILDTTISIEQSRYFLRLFYNQSINFIEISDSDHSLSLLAIEEIMKILAV
jgi:Prolyl oligopeptidase family